MTPFADASTSECIDELTIENRADRLDLYGSLSITRDKQGLRRARALLDMLSQTIQVLESEDLPDQIQERPSDLVTNPFAD
jgi:hypothetical protein